MSWLSNFPDEQEVLYFDATFSIKNIHKIEDSTFLAPTFDTTLFSVNTIRDLQHNTQFIEKSILKALQTINTESTILSFNEIDDTIDFEDNDIRINSNLSLMSMDTDDQETTALMKSTSYQPIKEDAEFRDDSKDQQDVNQDDNLESSMDDNDEKKESSNKSTDDKETKDIETFNKLKGSELIAILYLLYLQYKPSEWEKLVKSDEDIYTQIALAKYRDQFGHLTQNVTTIYLEKSSDLIKYFFSMNMDNNGNDSITNEEEIRNIIQRQGKFQDMKYDINFETIIKLFPKCKQLSIDGDNFDWSLKDFIAFLRRFNLDFSGIYLQDIFLRFKQNDYMSHSSQETAKKRLKKTNRKQLTELAKLGWRFINSSHIHRFGFEPEEEKPFLILFMTEGRVFHHSYSKRLIGTTPKMGLEQESFVISGQNSDNFYDASNKQLSFYGRAITMQSLHSVKSSATVKSYGIGTLEGDHAIIDYNPKHLFLSQQILDKCHYKRELIAALENRKQTVYKESHQIRSSYTSSTDKLISPIANQLQHQVTSMSFIDEELFDDLCRKVETLILYPIHEDLYTIFYETFAEKKKSILELMTIKLVFPNVTDIYLRKTTFNSRICDNLISFIIDCGKNNKSKSKIKRIFYSIDKQCASRDVAKLKLRLNVYRWDFSTIEQVAYKQELQDIV